MKFTLQISASIFFLFPLLFTAQSCQTEGCTNEHAINYDSDAGVDDGSCEFTNGVEFQLDFYIDESPLVVDQETYTNAAGNAFFVSRLQMYLSEIELHLADNSKLMIADFHYFDLLDSSSYKVKLTDVEHNMADSISFIFGLRNELNTNYALPNDIENINMQWPTPMGGGYHYMKFEGKFAHSDGQMHNYNVHLGRLVDAKGKSDPYFRKSFALNNVELNSDVLKIKVIMNLNGWFDGEENYNMENFGEGIMGSHKAQRLLEENGIDNVFKIAETWHDQF
ncbi:MAG: hypothetical protein JXQ87_05755 [Bacteroidia bacterium]